MQRWWEENFLLTSSPNIRYHKAMEWNRPEIKIPKDIELALLSVEKSTEPCDYPKAKQEVKPNVEVELIDIPMPVQAPVDRLAVVSDHLKPHIPPNSPWAICADPPPETRNNRYLYQLLVDKNRRWTISLIDTSTGSRRNHASGSGGIQSMNKQVYSGEEFAKLRGLSL